MTDLTRIANKHNTDKGTVAYEAHGYTEEYSKYIPNTGDYTLLEIGIWHGDSLRMWGDYNPDMNIHGIDIDYNCLRWLEADLHPFVHIGDATNATFIEKVVNVSGEPDFIVDDGSHTYEDIIASFKLLYPKLKPGGYYFIEDLHAPHAQSNLVFDSLDLYLKESGYSKQWQESKLVCNNKLLIIQK